MPKGFIKSEDEVVYSTAEEEMWEEELESRREYELSTGMKYDAYPEEDLFYGNDPFDVESKRVDYAVYGEESWD